jgi:hypothetical protein
MGVSGAGEKRGESVVPSDDGKGISTDERQTSDEQQSAAIIAKPSWTGNVKPGAGLEKRQGVTTPQDSFTEPLSRFGAPAARSVEGRLLPTATHRYPQLAQLAGKADSDVAQRGVKEGLFPGVPSDVIVEGPSAFSEASRRKAPDGLVHASNKVALWTSFQLASATADLFTLGDRPTHLVYPSLVGKDLARLTTEAGPDGRPKLLPGDFLLSGVDGGTSHLSIYIGDDPATGAPQLIHALATKLTQQSLPQLIGNITEAARTADAPADVGQATSGTAAKVGTFQEGVAEFFDRFHRDTYVVLRDPRLTDGMRQKGIEKLKTLRGTGYDYDLNQNNLQYYCSELAVVMLQDAYGDSGMKVPWVGTTPIDQLWFSDLVATPDNFLASPDFVATAMNETGRTAYERVVEGYVSGVRPVVSPEAENPPSTK